MRLSRSSAIFVFIFILGLGLSLTTQSLKAEGSVDLTDNGGKRAYLEWANSTNAGILRRSIIKAYVNAGEVVYFGSSTHTSDDDPDDILWRGPGSTTGTCDVVNAGLGHIQDRAQEVNGPAPIGGGYTPCIIAAGATQTGIYEFEFRAPADAGNPPPIVVGNNFAVDGTTNSTVAAWDVTVATAANVALPGRVFTNLLALNMGNTGHRLNSILTILTHDGYQYEVNLNGIDPFGFLYFSNTKGPRDAAGNPLYQSVQLTGPNPGQLPPGVTFLNPNSPDNAATHDNTHKIFFNTPDATLPTTATLPDGSTTWLLNPPTPPPPPQNFRFEGNEANTPGQAGTNPLGGTFRFDSVRIASFAIRLDLNRDGEFGNDIDRVLTGIASVGANAVTWDGLDAEGNAVAAGNIPYNADIETFAGEIHFPFIDPEANIDGIIIQRTVDPNTTTVEPNPFTIYYNDVYNYTGTNTYDYSICNGATDFDGTNPPQDTDPSYPGTPLGCYGTGPAPRLAVRTSTTDGVVSGTDIFTGGGHEFTANFGDRRIIETWAYYPSNISNIPSGILIAEIDLAIVKTITTSPVIRGGAITFNIVVTNNGPSNAVGATVQDTFEPYFTNVSWTCQAQGTAACAANGTGNINDTVNINAGAGNSVTYTVTATLDPSAPNNITNTATTTRPLDVNEPDTTNNTSTVTVALVDAPAMTINKDDGLTEVSASGQQTTYTITYSNTGGADAVNVTITDNIPAGATFVSCSNGCTGTGPVTWNIGTVTPGTTANVTITVDLPAAQPPTTHINTASLNFTDSSNTTYPDPSDTDENIVTGGPTLTPTLTVTPGGPTVTPGGPTVTPVVGGPTATPGGPLIPPDSGTVDDPTPVLISTTTPLIGGPEISKSVFPAFLSPGGTATWTITVRNSTNVVLTDLVITDQVPGELIITSSGGGTVNGQTITWTINTLNIGEVVRFNVGTQVRDDITAANIRNFAILETGSFVPPDSSVSGSGGTVSTSITPDGIRIVVSDDLVVVSSLPSTGEVPDRPVQDLGLFIGFAAVTTALFGNWWRRQQSHR